MAVNQQTEQTPSVFANYMRDPEKDGFVQPDIPQDVQAELLACSSRMHINFYWLCAIYRMALQAGLASANVSAATRSYSVVADGVTAGETALLRRFADVVKAVAAKGYRFWDTDEDSKAGKVLSALAGVPGCYPEIDKLYARIESGAMSQLGDGHCARCRRKAAAGTVVCDACQAIADGFNADIRLRGRGGGL